jgi:succinate dehydrogenase/fumarate reductase flavoprotein subunit
MNTKFNIIPIETDVLVIGGGLAGCMAAIKASEADVDVTIADKAHITRSGQNGSGTDHIWAWAPEVHGKMGWTLEDLVEDHVQGQAYGFINREVFHRVAVESYDRVLDLESYGIKFRYEDSELPGKFRIVPQFHCVASSFNFDGRNIKPILSKQVSKRGIRVVNRVMMTDLLVTDGRISGALGVGTRTHEIYVFKAKSVVLSTGRAGRLSRNTTGTDFNLNRPPGQTGDGKIMALNSGCRLINMEFFGRKFLNIGPYQQSTGSPRSTTWPAGAMVNSKGETIIPKTYFTNWDKYLGENAKKIDFAERRQKWLNALKGWLFLRHLEEEGLDIRNDKIEFTWNNAQSAGAASSGVLVNDNLETGVKGLFAGGDEMGGIPWSSSQGAVGTGWLTGDKAAEFAKKQADHLPTDKGKLESLIEVCTKIVDNPTGIPWKEVERTVQDIVDFYRGEVVTEQTLLRGLERIKDLQENVFLKAESPHELMRCLEIRSIVDNAELLLTASKERKETRMVPFQFTRTDYPDQDDENWFAFLGISLKDGKLDCTKIPLKEN